MSSRPPLTRRDVLRAAALAALGGFAASACGPGYDTGPDPLRPLLERARADAAAAEALARSAPEHAELARQVATARSTHADALRAEVDRLNRPVPEEPGQAPAPQVDGLGGLAQRLADAHAEAAALVPALPRHRAGLVGSIAAGCASLGRLSPELGTDPPDETDPDTPTAPLPEESVLALQDALSAEHAAVWVYGLVRAFLPGAYARGLDAGAADHRDRRDACERVLTAAGVKPRPSQPAYVPPEPVTNEDSAGQLVVTAETDAARAWHGVLERTDDAALRTLATQALTGSATRCTSWRRETGRQPTALALPGRPGNPGS